MNEAYRLLALLADLLCKHVITPKEIAAYSGTITDANPRVLTDEELEVLALGELMRQRGEASTYYHATPRGSAALAARALREEGERSADNQG